MRSLLFCLFLAIGVSATPLEFPPMDPQARGFLIDVGGEWMPVKGNATSKKEAKYDPGPDYPQFLSGMPTFDEDAANFVSTVKMVQQMKGSNELEAVKLGPLPAMLKREKSSFTIYSGTGTTKITIHYTDGRDTSNRTPYDGLLEEVLRTFRMSSVK